MDLSIFGKPILKVRPCEIVGSSAQRNRASLSHAESPHSWRLLRLSGADAFVVKAINSVGQAGTPSHSNDVTTGDEQWLMN